MYELVIFDCDGVLVDSERLSAQVFSDVLARINVHMSAQTCFEIFKGRTLSDCYRHVEHQHGVELPNQFDDWLAQATLHAFDKELKSVKGVEVLIKQLMYKQIPICVASNGGHKKIHASLKQTELCGYFDNAIFSAQDVKKGKPAPDLFLYAAYKMNVDPKNACVIEDSVSGVNAALAAKMDVIYFNPDHLSLEGICSGAKQKMYQAHSMAAVSELLSKPAFNS